MTDYQAPLDDLPDPSNPFGALPYVYRQLGQLGHNGIDYPAAPGTPVKATADGYVIHAGWGTDHPWLTHHAGIAVLIDHGETITGYAHLSGVEVTEGQPVEAGETIGYTGETGTAHGAHLHYEMLTNPPAFNNGFAGRINPITAPEPSPAATTPDAE